MRMKIKMVAINYLPIVEIGRRRRQRRRRGGHEGEKEQGRDGPLVAGETYTFQLALTNPLYDPIQIRLTQPPVPKHAPRANCGVRIVTQHFTCNAAKDAWAYDEDVDGSGDEDEGVDARPSVLAGAGSSRDKRREPGVEKTGNISKVPIEVDISETGRGDVEFDLEVRFTYRVEGEGMPGRKGREEYKHFTFWVRVNLGEV